MFLVTPAETLETVPAVWLAGFIILWGVAMLWPLFRKTDAVRSRTSDERPATNSNTSPKKD
jgi:hypothetical protein